MRKIATREMGEAGGFFERPVPPVCLGVVVHENSCYARPMFATVQEEQAALQAQLRRLTMPTQRSYRRIVEQRLAELNERTRYPNVSRAEWSAMCRESEARQREARAALMRGETDVADAIYRNLQPLHAHMKAISHLEPTDGFPPRN